MSKSSNPDRIARLLFWLPLLLIAVAVLASVLALPHLPERVPIHWGLDGEPTRLASRGAAAFLMIAVMAHAWLMVGLIGWAVTKSNEAARMSPRVMPAVTAAVVGGMLLMHVGMLANGLGWKVPVPMVASVSVGLLYLVLGHKMRRVPPNPIFGVRTSTTLRSPGAWRRANEVGGGAFVYAGIATMLAAPLPGPWPVVVLLGATMLAAVAGLVAGRKADREAGQHA